MTVRLDPDLYQRCIYCGAWCYGRDACHNHKDLLAVDPNRAELDLDAYLSEPKEEAA